MPRLLTLSPDGPAIPVLDGCTLLEAALAAGIALRSACRNGTCRECRAQLVSGTVRYRVDWPGLSADEKAEGWVLPCLAVPTTDVVLHAPRRM